MVEKVDPVLFLQSLFASSFIALFMTATFLWTMVECGSKKPPPPPEEGQPKVAGGYVSKSCNKQTGLLNEDQELNSERLKAAAAQDQVANQPKPAEAQPKPANP